MKLFFIFYFLTACAGYTYRDKENPFMQFGIRSISVPMFYNHSSFANVEGVFTKEILNTMLGYKSLILKSGKQPADAVLIGIVSSPDRRKDAATPNIFSSVKNIYGNNVFEGRRDDLYVPTQNTMQLSLRIIVIKQPTKEEIVFLSTKLGEKAIGSKIIFNEVIALNGTQSLKQFTGDSMKVIGTQNRGVERSVIETMAKNAAGNFKDMILYAF